jgi:hypothetical protein
MSVSSLLHCVQRSAGIQNSHAIQSAHVPCDFAPSFSLPKANSFLEHCHLSHADHSLPQLGSDISTRSSSTCVRVVTIKNTSTWRTPASHFTLSIPLISVRHRCSFPQKGAHRLSLGWTPTKPFRLICARSRSKMFARGAGLSNSGHELAMNLVMLCGWCHNDEPLYYKQ